MATWKLHKLCRRGEDGSVAGIGVTVGVCVWEGGGDEVVRLI